MRRYLLVLALVSFCVSDPTEFALPISSDVHQKLSLSLEKLASELSYFRTPYEDKVNLYKRVAITEQYLQEASNQLYQYDNVILGAENKVEGNKNIIVGSYNDITGSNNFVFIEKFTGKANGDLLIGKWRVEIDKKKLILVNSSLAVSFINEDLNRKYLRYLTNPSNRAFSYGSTTSDNTFMVIHQSESSQAAVSGNHQQSQQQTGSHHDSASSGSHSSKPQSQYSQNGGSVYQYSTNTGLHNVRQESDDGIQSLLDRRNIFVQRDQPPKERDHELVHRTSSGYSHQPQSPSTNEPNESDTGSSSSGLSFGSNVGSDHSSQNSATRYYSKKGNSDVIGGSSTGSSDHTQYPTSSQYSSSTSATYPSAQSNPFNIQVRSNLGPRYLRTGGSYGLSGQPSVSNSGGQTVYGSRRRSNQQLLSNSLTRTIRSSLGLNALGQSVGKIFSASKSGGSSTSSDASSSSQSGSFSNEAFNRAQTVTSSGTSSIQSTPSHQYSHSPTNIPYAKHW